MKKNINFENAQELRGQYPDTFYAPDKEELQQLKPGDSIKVCAYQERFWAEVISIEDRMVTARVDNMLLTPLLKFNDVITVHTDNIYNILSSPVAKQATAVKIIIPGRRSKGRKI